MTKKQVWKQILKYIGIGAGICAGIIGLVVGVVAIQTHGFKPKQVPLSSCSFNIETDKFRGLSNNIPVFVINEDSTFVVKPNPDDCTELDAKLQIKAGDSLIKDIQIEAEEQVEGQETKYVSAEKVGNKYLITLGQPFKIVLVENHSEILATRTIDLYVESESEYCEAKVFVDSKLESFELKTEKISTFQSDYLFKDDYVYAYIDINSVLPQSSLSMSNLVDLTKDFKMFEFKIDNESVAEIVETESGVNTTDSSPIANYKKGFPYAKIKIKTSGNFKLTLTICDLFSNEEHILSQEDFSNMVWTDEEKEEYEQWLEDVQIQNSYDFEVSDVQIGSISANKTAFNFDLFEGKRISATQLNLKVNPREIEGSPFTSEDLSYHIQDVELACGILVSEQDSYDFEFGSGSNKKYVKLTDNYISIKKEQGNNEPVWVVSATDVTSNQLCLVASLTVGEDTWSDYVPVNINAVRMVELELKNQSGVVSFIELDFDADPDKTQQTYTALSNDWVFDKQTNQTLNSLIQSGGYPYTKIVFVVEGSDGTLSLQDEIIKLELTETGYVLTPLGKGNSKVCAIVLKTDINGNLVDKDNSPIIIEDETSVDVAQLLERCQVVVKSDAIDVEVHQVLKINANKTMTLYKEVDGQYTEITEEDELFEIKKDSNDSVEEAKIYNGQKVYLKLNVNDADAMYEAFNDTLTFNLGTDIPQSDKFVKLGTSLIKATIDEKVVCLLELEIFNVENENLTENLQIYFNGRIQCNLSIKGKKFILSSLTLSSNAGEVGDIYLVLDSQRDAMRWTIDYSNPQDKPLELNLEKFPSQAEGHNEIVYKIYALRDQSTDISTLGTLTDEIISQYFVEDNSVIEIKSGYPVYDENDMPTLQFNIKQEGTVFVIASCTRYSDNVKLFSNIYQINTKYPDVKEQTFNYGTNYGIDYEYLSTDFVFVKTTDTTIDSNKTYYVLEDNKYVKVEILNVNNLKNYYEKQFAKYRRVVASYDKQLTNLLDFIGTEKTSIGGSEGAEGSKIGLQWKPLNSTDESSWFTLHQGLYEFKVLTQSLNIDFYQDEDGIHYVRTNKVTEKVFFKIKVSTKFGYEFKQTYNYVLVPDYSVDANGVENNVVNMNAGESKTLFKIGLVYTKTQDTELDSNKTYYVLENDRYVQVENPSEDNLANYYEIEIGNDGGLFFVTNQSSTNYRLGNDNKLTGYKDGERITIIYLPNDMKDCVLDMLSLETTTSDVVTLDLGGKHYEIRFGLRFSFTDPYGDIKINCGEVKSKAVEQGISPLITFNAMYYIKTKDTIIDATKTYFEYVSENNKYIQVENPSVDNLANYYERIVENGLFHFTLNVSPIMEIKLNEDDDTEVVYAELGTSLETTFADGKEIDLSKIVSLEKIDSNNLSVLPVNTPTCSLVDTYDNFKIVNYIKTTDTTIDSNKTYYVFEDDKYVQVENPSVDNIANYYEYSEKPILVMSGSIIGSFNLQIKFNYTVSLENDFKKIVSYTLNLLVKPK